MLSPLNIPAFRHLLLAQVIALFGTGLTTVALALLAHQLAGGQAGQVLGFALALKMVAYVLIAPLFGAVALKLPRRSFLVALDVFRAVSVALLPFVTEIWQIYLLVFTLNVFSAGFTPVFQATIPHIVKDPEEYTRALSLSRLAYDLENLLSPMIAGALILTISFSNLFLFNGIAFLVSAALVMHSGIPPMKQGADVDGFWVRVSRGISIYLKTPRLRAVLALSLAVSSAGAMQIVNTVVYVRTELGLGESWVAWAMAAAGGGSMVAAFTLPRLSNRWSFRRIQMTGGLMMSLAVLLGVTLPSIGGLMVLWGIVGAGTALVLTPIGRLLTESCQESDRPALFSAQFSLSHACWLITYPLAGWLGAQVGLISGFMVLGGVALVSVLIAAYLWPATDSIDLLHRHEAMHHTHLHYHDEHHQHRHEGWEGPEPHSHPHEHSTGEHRHPFVIDRHHPDWPDSRS
uniref:MFS transporter n=1 Tax=Saccharospirillum salsuginis TaxID=418750 RepID=UPI001673EA2D|nr:MFS transporter [Saccharospirillum salsuginis]